MINHTFVILYWHVINHTLTYVLYFICVVDLPWWFFSWFFNLIMKLHLATQIFFEMELLKLVTWHLKKCMFELVFCKIHLSKVLYNHFTEVHWRVLWKDIFFSGSYFIGINIWWLNCKRVWQLIDGNCMIQTVLDHTNPKFNFYRYILKDG